MRDESASVIKLFIDLSASTAIGRPVLNIARIRRLRRFQEESSTDLQRCDCAGRAHGTTGNFKRKLKSPATVVEPSSFKNSGVRCGHSRGSGNPELSEIPGFRVSLAIASSPGMTVDLCNEFQRHHTSGDMKFSKPCMTLTGITGGIPIAKDRVAKFKAVPTDMCAECSTFSLRVQNVYMLAQSRSGFVEKSCSIRNSARRRRSGCSSKLNPQPDG